MPGGPCPARGRGRSVSIAAPQHPRHPRHRRGEERSAAQRGSPVLPRAGWAPRPPSEQPEGPGAASHRPHPLLPLRSPPAFSVIFYFIFFFFPPSRLAAGIAQHADRPLAGAMERHRGGAHGDGGEQGGCGDPHPPFRVPRASCTPLRSRLGNLFGAPNPEGTGGCRDSPEAR